MRIRPPSLYHRPTFHAQPKPQRPNHLGQSLPRRVPVLTQSSVKLLALNADLGGWARHSPSPRNNAQRVSDIARMSGRERITRMRRRDDSRLATLNAVATRTASTSRLRVGNKTGTVQRQTSA